MSDLHVRQLRILQAARLRKDERVSLRAWTMARCYSGSAAELVYHQFHAFTPCPARWTN